jgi:hypothetical protein
MAYSGTRTFNLNISEIIEEAFERCGLEVRSGYDLKTARRSLNLMFSDWANRGLNLWTIDYYFKTLTAGTNNFALDQKVIDVVDATITTTAYDATDTTPVNRGLEGGSSTTDVNVTKISRTEYMDLSRKNQTGSSGTARPTQFTVINGVSTYSDITDVTTATSGRPEQDIRVWLYPTPDKAYVFKYFYLNRIQDAGDYTDNAGVPFYFLPCLVSGLAYYMSLKRSPMMAAGLKAVYDEEFDRTADANRERVSFRVKPAQAYIP